MTKIILKPLRRASQLKKLTASNCEMCVFDSDMFELTFQVGWKDGKKVQQDLALFFEKGTSVAYLSEPYMEEGVRGEF